VASPPGASDAHAVARQIGTIIRNQDMRA
jgi:hypothetical protein